MHRSEVVSSPRSHRPAWLGLLNRTNATQASAGPVPGRCPLISKKEQSLQPRPPRAVLPAQWLSHHPASWACSLRKNKKERKSGSTRWPSCSFSQHLWSSGAEVRCYDCQAGQGGSWQRAQVPDLGSNTGLWLGNSCCDPGPGWLRL